MFNLTEAWQGFGPPNLWPSSAWVNLWVPPVVGSVRQTRLKYTVKCKEQVSSYPSVTLSNPFSFVLHHHMSYWIQNICSCAQHAFLYCIVLRGKYTLGKKRETPWKPLHRVEPEQQIHTYGQFRVCCLPDLLVFGLWKETSALMENLCDHGKKVKPTLYTERLQTGRILVLVTVLTSEPPCHAFYYKYLHFEALIFTFLMHVLGLIGGNIFSSIY